MAALSGTSRIRTEFSNGWQRSVNRKVQGSNPCSGAKSEFRIRPVGSLVSCWGLTATRSRAAFADPLATCDPALPAHSTEPAGCSGDSARVGSPEDVACLVRIDKMTRARVWI